MTRPLSSEILPCKAISLNKRNGFNSRIVSRNIDNLSVKLYDYVESDNIIGEAIDNTLYLVFMKDGSVLDYEKFLDNNEG